MVKPPGVRVVVLLPVRVVGRALFPEETFMPFAAVDARDANDELNSRIVCENG